MNRYDKYKESIQKFVMTLNNIDQSITDYVSKDNKMIPTILLTILNSQNKKNNISIQGYHLAISIECMLLLLNTYENDTKSISKILQIKNLIANLVLNNVIDVKNTYSNSKVNTIFIKLMETYNNFTKQLDMFIDFKFDVIEINVHQDISKWYIRDTQSPNAVKLSQLNQIKKDSFEKYMDSSIVLISEYAMLMGWIIGNGDQKMIPKIKQIAKNFAYIYKISRDFANIEIDINDAKKYSNNFVINYGLQESYNIFIKNKIRFTEDALAIDILTPTIREILDYATKNIDDIIDQSSPDIRSGFSKIY